MLTKDEIYYSYNQKHENIRSILDYYEGKDYYHIIMELCDGNFYAKMRG